MSLLLNALKKAEEGEQSAATSQEAGGESVAPDSPTPASPPAQEASAAPIDFDSIVDDSAEEKKADPKPEEVERKKRVDAARVFGAARHAEVEESGSGPLKKLLVTSVALVFIGGGGFFVLDTGLIPGVDLQSVKQLIGQQDAPRAPEVRIEAGAQLKISEDVVLLPVPAVDVQNEVDFAALRLPENARNTIGEDEYIKQIAFLTGFDINKERTRKADEQRELLLDLEAEADELESLTLSEGGEVPEEELAIIFTADASREAKIELDTATPSDNELDIVIKAEEEEADASTTDDVAVADSTAETETTADLVVKKSAQVNIQQSEAGKERNEMVRRAQSLYDRRSYVQAEAVYRNVLLSSPKNRDALRGVAQIAVITGRYQIAVAMYLDVLEYYPNDPVAIAELANLRGSSGDFYALEKALKNALGKSDQADARLYFSLGNLYAQHSKFSEAQKAYFDAFSRESGNPDYAYNLAVVLDYLNKQSLAVRYYQEAVRLSQGVPIGFNRAEAEARIKDLN